MMPLTQFADTIFRRRLSVRRRRHDTADVRCHLMRGAMRHAYRRRRQQIGRRAPRRQAPP